MTARFLTIVDADFALDGGAMMGIVPRPLWEKAHPPDDRNRIALVSRFAVVDDRAAGRLWLVDCGIGRDWGPKETGIYVIRPRGIDARSLVRAAGFDPDDVTDVVLTHLHFDHCAGLVRTEPRGSAAGFRGGPGGGEAPGAEQPPGARGPGGGEARGAEASLAFPSAVHHVQAAQLEWARSPSVKDAGSFRADHVAVLASDARLSLAGGDGPLGGAVSVRVASGHSPGMQIVLVETAGGTHVFCGDLVPTWSHVRLPWVMAYDTEPVRTIEEKRRLFSDVADRGWVLVSEHDPRDARARIRRGRSADSFDVETFSTPDDR